MPERAKASLSSGSSPSLRASTSALARGARAPNALWSRAAAAPRIPAMGATSSEGTSVHFSTRRTPANSAEGAPGNARQLPLIARSGPAGGVPPLGPTRRATLPRHPEPRPSSTMSTPRPPTGGPGSRPRASTGAPSTRPRRQSPRSARTWAPAARAPASATANSPGNARGRSHSGMGTRRAGRRRGATGRGAPRWIGTAPAAYARASRATGGGRRIRAA